LTRKQSNPAGFRRRWWPWLLLPIAAASLVVVVTAPTETRQGVDFRQLTFTLPLYQKAIDFVQRDLSHSLLAQRLVDEHASTESRVLTIFNWTRENIRDLPAGFPIIDDHISHIIIRGYGTDDQKADVFTTMATYAGVPAFFASTGDFEPSLVLSYAWIDNRWKVFDVVNDVAFRNRSGALASVEELAGDPWVLESVSAERVYREKAYASYFVGFRPPEAPDILRAELQMLWPRASYRLKRLLGLGQRDWQAEQ